VVSRHGVSATRHNFATIPVDSRCVPGAALSHADRSWSES
jgi:hypothetical protein